VERLGRIPSQLLEKNKRFTADLMSRKVDAKGERHDAARGRDTNETFACIASPSGHGGKTLQRTRSRTEGRGLERKRECQNPDLLRVLNAQGEGQAKGGNLLHTALSKRGGTSDRQGVLVESDRLKERDPEKVTLGVSAMSRAQ